MCKLLEYDHRDFVCVLVCLCVCPSLLYIHPFRSNELLHSYLMYVNKGEIKLVRDSSAHEEATCAPGEHVTINPVILRPSEKGQGTI